MITLRKKDFTDRGNTKGEIRCGISSWDDGSNNASSVKWAYRDNQGKVSRGCPEVPIDVLFEMVDFVCSNKDILSLEDRKFVEKFLNDNKHPLEK